MLLTEDEAKEKLCPYLSSNAFFDVSNNKYTGTREYRLVVRKCWASKCMMWQAPEEYDGEAGYCGLAGRVTE